MVLMLDDERPKAEDDEKVAPFRRPASA